MKTRSDVVRTICASTSRFRSCPPTPDEPRDSCTAVGWFPRRRWKKQPRRLFVAKFGSAGDRSIVARAVFKTISFFTFSRLFPTTHARARRTNRRKIPVRLARKKLQRTRWTRSRVESHHSYTRTRPNVIRGANNRFSQQSSILFSTRPVVSRINDWRTTFARNLFCVSETLE